MGAKKKKISRDFLSSQTSFRHCERSEAIQKFQNHKYILPIRGQRTPFGLPRRLSAPRNDT
jgi:hypothetical protein